MLWAFEIQCEKHTWKNMTLIWLYRTLLVPASQDTLHGHKKHALLQPADSRQNQKMTKLRSVSATAIRNGRIQTNEEHQRNSFDDSQPPNPPPEIYRLDLPQHQPPVSLNPNSHWILAQSSPIYFRSWIQLVVVDLGNCSSPATIILTEHQKATKPPVS